MRKIYYVLFILTFISCTPKTTEQRSSIAKIEVTKSQESNDGEKDIANTEFSEVIKDSIIDSNGKISSILEKIILKEKFVEYHGDSCNDIKFNLRCYQSQELLFSKTILKNDFYKFFDTVNLKINKYMLTSCYIDSVARNPFKLTFRLNICRPMSADCFNFILKFDDKGNYTVISDIDRDNESM